MTLADYIYVLPILMLAISAMVVLVLGTITDRFPKGRVNHWMPPEYLAIAVMVPTVFMAAVALWESIGNRAQGVTMFEGVQWLRSMILMDPFAAFMGLIAVIGTLVVVVLSTEYFGDHNTKNRGEYFALLFFGTTAILLLSASIDLIMIYLSMEFLSLSSYVLAAYWKNDSKSSEAGIKYFLFGAISSAIMLYGMSMLFGLVGSTNLGDIAAMLGRGQLVLVPAAWTAVIMVMAGLGFKLALVPFHLWAPDTYEGAPTPITAWLSVASKAAGIAVATRFLLVAVPLSSGINWLTLLIVLSAASMTLGNMVAITQGNIKRMLAYSSIAQVGYMLIGLVAAAATQVQPSVIGPINLAVKSVEGTAAAYYNLSGLLIYAASYLFMNLGAFAVIIAVERRTGRSEIDSFSGLWRTSPFLAGSMVVFFMSLAGIPPTAGFLGKALVFAGAIQSGRQDLLVLAIIGIANSVISVYYYFNVVRVMFMKDAPADAKMIASRPLKAVVMMMLFMTVGMLVAAAPVWRLVQAALG
jgi:proton-translocating NADH-quinone oxidoreductase chain N